MRYKPGHKEEARARILAAAGRSFRSKGLGGIGVDGVAKEAGVTSGAFYVHFASKDEAFMQAVAEGLRELLSGIEAIQAEHEATWLPRFIDYYLGPKRTCDLSEGCAFQALGAEVSRSPEGAEVRQVYEAELKRVIEAVANGLSGGTKPDREARAWALLSLLAGGVTAARGLADEKLAARAAKAVRAAALVIAESTPPH